MIQPKKALLNAKGYASSLYPEDYFLKLDLNENLFGPSPKVLEAIKNIDAKDIQFYPAYGELIEKLAKYNSIDTDMIMPANGADEAISLIFNTFIEADDAVLTITPTFGMYKIYAKSTGCSYKEVPYKEKWQFPVDEFINNIDNQVKLIIITTPNSPTGESISRGDLLKIIENAKDKLILIDETYSNFAKEKFTDLALKYDNIIIVRSLSKDYALAGLRIGYIITNEHNIDFIRNAASPYSVNTIATIAAIASLDDQEHIKWVKDEVKISKKMLYEGLNDLAETVYPSESNFIFVDFGEKAEFIYKKLLNSGIKVKYFKDSANIQSCFRITVPPKEKVEIFLNSLRQRDLIIFDMDGVLVDVRNSYRMAIKGTYEHFAKQELSSDKIQQAKNFGGLNNDWDLTKFLLDNSGFNISRDDIINKFQELYFGNNGTGHIQNESLLTDPEFLRNLAKKYDLAIFTGRPRLEAEFVLKKWNIEDLFSVIITMDDVPDGLHKPDPYGINKILKTISPKNTYYLGDTPDDMISARKAGINGIGILPPQDKTEELRKKLISEGAMVVLDSVQNLLDSINIGANHARK